MSVTLPQINSPITGQLFPSHLYPPTTSQKLDHRTRARARGRQDGAAITTFRSTYPAPPGDFSRTQTIDPPPPASVIHKNSCFLRMHESQTQNTYRPPGKVVTDKVSDSGRMYATNFHANADKRLETHRTTAQDGFQPVAMQGGRAELPVRTADSSPLGKRAHTLPVQSEYSTTFINQDRVGVVGSQTVEMKGDGRNTITGRMDTGNSKPAGWEGLVTTHCDTYRGDPLKSINPPSHTAYIQQMRLTSIPQGDPSKVVHQTTNLQDSYRPPPPPSTRPSYNKSQAVRVINGSSICLSDRTVPPSEYFSTTAMDTYRSHGNPGRAVPYTRFPRNASFFPRGDLDPTRVSKRIKHTTTGTTHARPPSGSYPHHVDGSNLHTFSRVHLGGSRFYRYSTFGSTMADSYSPLSAPTHRVRAPSRDNIPLNYCSGHLSSPTTAASYPSHGGVKRDKPNPEALKNLKCSHWQLPLTGPPSYSTTHRDCFHPPQ